MKRDRIALLFDRTYIDAHPCFLELANHLVRIGFGIDLYMKFNSANYQPFFENQDIQLIPFPVSKIQRTEYWYKIFLSKERKYKAIIGTPVAGAWLAFRTARVLGMPYYYFADELVEHLIISSPEKIRARMASQNYKANRFARASIALGEVRYLEQKELNKIDYPHEHVILPNAPSGPAVHLRSNYFRDIFNIEDRKPILLFIGTIQWNLAKRLYEETKDYSDRDYHIIFHGRTLGLMGNGDHPFIKVSTFPLPSALMNYAVSSADIGLALYDQSSTRESRNAFTGGKIGTYLKNELPIIAGNAVSLKVFEEQKVGIYWDGELEFDVVAKRAITNLKDLRQNIRDFYSKNFQYELFFESFRKHLIDDLGKSSGSKR